MRRFVKFAFWLAVLQVVFFSSLSAQALYEPFTLREDFQGDSLGQFASYPPPQDYGYEPSITPTSDLGAPGGRSLMRVWKPNRDGHLRFGFIRPIYLQASSDGRVSISYFLNNIGQGDRIELGLAGSDGCRYQAWLPAKSGSWSREQVALADFRCGGKPIASGVGIEAFYIVAELKNADADTTYRFLIDDFAMQARRPAEFEVQNPRTVRIESQNAAVAAKSYAGGDTVSVAAVSPARVDRATARILDQDGKAVASQPLYDDGTHGDSKAGDGVWTNNAVYTLKPSDPNGVWKIELQGTAAKGETVETDVRFVHGSTRRLAHPRLYFDAKDRDALIARTRDPKAAAIWQKILADAEARRTGDIEQAGRVFEMLDTGYLLPSLLGYFDAMNSARLRIEPNALVAYLTGDATARQSAKTALLDVSRWSRWEPPWFTAHGQHTYYPAGQMSAAVALAYDLLYDDLTEAERSLVRRALIENAIIPVYKEYVLDNRVSANTSNWIAHTVGGALIAASAIAGDVKPDEASGQFDVYLNGLLLKLERHLTASYLPDGSYGEGISYKEFDLETTGPALVAVDRVFGIDYWSRTHVKDSTLYSLYTFAQPVEGSLDMGDSHPPSGRTLAPVVKYSKNPTDKWFYDQFTHNAIPDFLFFDDSVAPRPPDLPTSRIFNEKGDAVFRSGWGKDSIVFLFRAGPDYNHNHADQGSFLLTAFGEPLITEAGWSDYYKDPYYATYFTQAIGHNTVLVDRDPESQSWPDTRQFAALDSYPTITDSLTSEFYDGVGSSLESVYEGRLSAYVRRIVFVKPYYFVVFDDLKAGQPAAFDFLLHLPD
ncbi:MAG TPA: heparinase II/III family protein, partial [Pyrinomonadaceae bacterium]|nr:heparinase II/III family protein [Pyrinomonadaceae bacterium]